MKNSQLEKLALITESTLIVGVDIAPKTHYKNTIKALSL